MRRRLHRASAFTIDAGVLAAAFVIAFLVRFDWDVPAPMVGRLLLVGPYVVALEFVMLLGFGIHRFSWRYVGLREASAIFVAHGASTLVLVGTRLAGGVLQHDVPFLRHGVIPLGVLAVNFLVGGLGLVGVRVLRRTLGERADSAGDRALRRATGVRTMFVGAGRAGSLVARELQRSPSAAVTPCGFLDDDATKVGTLLHGVPVVGTTAELVDQCRACGAEQVIITIASVTGPTVRRIRRTCKEAGLPVKIIPAIDEIVDGRVSLSRTREVKIEDLLKRSPVELESEEIEGLVGGQVVLVTGAGGSIGSELCRQLLRFSPRRLVLVERAENSLFHIHRELTQLEVRGIETVPVLADVTAERRMASVFRAHRPGVVLHAAAHKHVPLMEWNPVEAVRNNVFGTRVVARLAHEHGANVFTMISTDKAVRPSSIMGATKRIAERIVHELDAHSATRFVTVRFGNVLGSAGSVVPIFKQQIARGGPVTITHPEMTRYFMTIPEACQLVLQAGSMGHGGELFILDMGTPVKITQLAEDLISLSGLRPGEDIEIAFVGTRPGEKLHEELATSSEETTKTRHPKIFVGRTTADVGTPPLDVHLRALQVACEGESNDDVIDALALGLPAFAERRRTLSSGWTGDARWDGVVSDGGPGSTREGIEVQP